MQNDRAVWRLAGSISDKGATHRYASTDIEDSTKKCQQKENPSPATGQLARGCAGVGLSATGKLHR